MDALGDGRTVLLIDDQPDNRVIFGTILRHVGFRILEASSGREGIRLAREHPPELILLDIGMPEMDGWETMEHLQQREETAHIPTLVLTAYELDLERLERAGFCGYLRKPLDPRCLAEEVERCLGLLAGQRISALHGAGSL